MFNRFNDLFGNLFVRNRSSKKTSKGRRGPTPRRLGFESLERRELLTVSHGVALPVAPAFTATVASSTQINLAWNTVSGATGYKVDELINGAWTQIGSFGSNVKSDPVTGLSPGTSYSFEVGASNSAGTTFASSKIATTLAVLPAAPTLSSAAVSTSQINLSWNSVSGATGYKVEEWINNAWTQVGSLGSNATSDAVTGLNAGTTYYLEVAAYNSAGSNLSNMATVSTLLAAPPANPTLTALAVSGSQINLSWSAAAGATGYYVDEWINNVWTQIGNLGNNATNDPVTGLSAGTAYFFDVIAYNSAGTAWSNSMSISTLQASLPAAPTLSATAVSGSQINLAWNPVAGATGYNVNELIGGSWWQIASLSSNATSDPISGLAAGTAYSFEVAAYNAAGSNMSNIASATTTLAAPPASPSLSATPVSSSQINLSWNGVAGATGYNVNELIGGSWRQIGSFSSSTTSASVTGLNIGTAYSFEVAAYNAAGSNTSNIASATTLLGAPPAAPILSATPVSSSQINLSWNGVAGATSYQVEEVVNGAWKQIAILGSGTTSDPVTGLSAGTSYTFVVIAINSAGSMGSNTVSATTSSAFVIDHPNPTTLTGQSLTYVPVSGSLFGASGPLFTDVHQGEVGDCWLMASLAEVAARYPQDIRNMFTAAGTTVENGSVVNLYTVRFFNSANSAVYVTVDTELPNGGGTYDQPANGVLWVALAEKAYAQANGKGYVTTGLVGSDSYSALNEGQPSWALQAITGNTPSVLTSISPTGIAAAWNAGQLIVLGTSPNAGDNLIVGDYSNGTHAYAVVSYNASSSNPFELYNPWGESSVLGGTVPYNNHQVYGGAFWASASLISTQYFASQSIGIGAEADTLDLSNGSQTVAIALETNSSASTATTHDHGQTNGSSISNAAVVPASIVQQRSAAAVDNIFAAWGEDDDADILDQRVSSSFTHDFENSALQSTRETRLALHA